MEERVHPIPFRTWKLSSPSPMILHNVMWESRPLPTSFKKPFAAQARRAFCCSVPCTAKAPTAARLSLLHVSLPLTRKARATFFALQRCLETPSALSTSLQKNTSRPAHKPPKLLPSPLAPQKFFPLQFPCRYLPLLLHAVVRKNVLARV